MASFVAATTTNKIENYTTPGDVTSRQRCRANDRLWTSSLLVRLFDALVHAIQR